MLIKINEAYVMWGNLTRLSESWTTSLLLCTGPSLERFLAIIFTIERKGSNEYTIAIEPHECLQYYLLSY
jgi:hypothetical protein